MPHQVERYHDISTGHRVAGHEGKCRHLHGHNYRVHFNCLAFAGNLDDLGRVIDFGDIKVRLCMWLENHWDHKFLLWEHDPVAATLCDDTVEVGGGDVLASGIVLVPFNPTAENMAYHLVHVVGPVQLAGTGIVLVSCRIEETRKCSVSYSL